jgi:uncharacterized protein HemX
METTPNMQGLPSDKQNGPVVGIIIVIIVLAIGAYYFFGQLQMQQPTQDMTGQNASSTMPADTGTTTDSVQADLNANQQDLNTLDAQTNTDLNALDQATQGM